MSLEYVAKLLGMKGMPAANGDHANNAEANRQCGKVDGCGSNGFQMPLHYPRYEQADYEVMPEWKLDCLLREYGLPIEGDVDQKRIFAIGAFIWS